MGAGSSSIPMYTMPVEDIPVPPDSSPVFRSTTHPDSLVSRLEDEPCDTTWDLFERGKKISGAGGPLLGKRARDPSTGEWLDHYEWMSFGEAEKVSRQFGTGLLRSRLIPWADFPEEAYAPARKLRLVGVFMKNCVEWFLTEYAGMQYNFTLVPLYDTLGEKALKYIVDKTKMHTVVCSVECLKHLLFSCEGSQLSNIIIVDPENVTEEQKSNAERQGLKLMNWDSVVAAGAGDEGLLPLDLPKREDINTVCYTSGTTGNPKGVLLTHHNVMSCVIATIRGPIANGFGLLSSDIHTSYLPLAHVFERLVCNVVLAMGALIGIYHGDTQKLLDDVKVLRPTVFISVPRLFNRINDVIGKNVADKTAMQRYMFKKGVDNKVGSLRHSADTNHMVWDSLVFGKMKALMGGRLRWMISGGAPIDPAVAERMKVFFCCPLMEGYGMTETFGPAFLCHPKDPVSGHVGGVYPCNEFRLESIPEMDYDALADPPVGELCLRGHAITVGYFRDNEETNVAFDQDGWLHTGDVAMLLPNGGIRIVDRKKNIFKLAQGEYVAPEKIENVYCQCQLISQIYVHGESSKTFPVAVVVPESDVVKKWAAKKGLDKSFEELCLLPDLKEAILAEMADVGVTAKLKGFEKVKHIHITSDAFSVEMGVLTPTLKIRRHQAKQKFQKVIDALYA